MLGIASEVAFTAVKEQCYVKLKKQHFNLNVQKV